MLDDHHAVLEFQQRNGARELALAGFILPQA